MPSDRPSGSKDPLPPLPPASGAPTIRHTRRGFRKRLWSVSRLVTPMDALGADGSIWTEAALEHLPTETLAGGGGVERISTGSVSAGALIRRFFLFL